MSTSVPQATCSSGCYLSLGTESRRIVLAETGRKRLFCTLPGYLATTRAMNHLRVGSGLKGKGRVKKILPEQAVALTKMAKRRQRRKQQQRRKRSFPVE